MSLQQRIGLGVTLGVDLAGGANYNTLGAIVNAIKFSGTKADVVDISLLSDIFKRYAKGQIDPGELEFEIAWDPGDNTASTNTNARIKTAHDATGVNTYPFQLTLPAIASPGTNTAQTINFSAHVTGVGPSLEKEKQLVASIKCKISGDPNF